MLYLLSLSLMLKTIIELMAELILFINVCISKERSPKEKQKIDKLYHLVVR